MPRRRPRARPAALLAACLAAATAPAAGLPPSPPPGRSKRRVRWFVDAFNVSANEQLAFEAGDGAVDGLLGTGGGTPTASKTITGLIRVHESGEVTVPGRGLRSSEECLRQVSEPFLKRGLTFHAALEVSSKAILGTGNATRSFHMIAYHVLMLTQRAGLTGVLIDYEPTTEPSQYHQQQYQSFLTEMLAEAEMRKQVNESATGLDIAMVVADSGIIQPSKSYAELHANGLSWYSSMKPTLSGKAATSTPGVAFVKEMTHHFTNRSSVSIGTMAETGFESKCVRDYEWTRVLLEGYLFGGMFTPTDPIWSLKKEKVCTVDIMRCDLAGPGYGKTAQYFFDILASWRRMVVIPEKEDPCGHHPAF